MLVAAALISGLLVTLPPTDVRAADASSQLSLPWATGLNGTLTGGPHNWNGTADPNHPWNSLDWVPSNGQVFAERGGTAHTNDCGAPGMIRIDHGDGYQTTYYHLDPASIQVANNSVVGRGQYIGNIGTSTPCGGSANGAHTHLSLWKFSGAFNFSDSQGYDLNGVQVGAWIVDDGSPQSQYSGCITPAGGGGRQCPSVQITNSGAIAGGGDSSYLVADNGAFVFVASGIHLRKYANVGSQAGYLSGSDLTGLTGPSCVTHNTNYACVGYFDMGAPITALAINASYLFIGLSTGRVIKTNMCGSGNNVCAFSDNLGGGSAGGYNYWIGLQDFSLGSVTALAANSTYLFMSLGTRTIKTTMCSTGGNMCWIANSGGTAGYAGHPDWVGFQDWSYPVIAQATSDAGVVFTSLSGINRVCKTDLGTTGGNVFWADPSCNAVGSSHWYGSQDMAVPVVGLAVDNLNVWWSLGSTPRLIETNMCGTGGNVCAFSDGYGSGTAGPSWNYWKGRQDWCAGWYSGGVTSVNWGNRSMVTTAVGPGTWRLVKSRDGSGGNMFATTDCGATASLNNYSYWFGYQDLKF